ncbi:hypothetical protein C8F01DRAFT_1179486 [Mycena amicta]|nr:hypothetical protein C8F01DRAFT_1179486 [Mycena amicta]
MQFIPRAWSIRFRSLASLLSTTAKRCCEASEPIVWCFPPRQRLPDRRRFIAKPGRTSLLTGDFPDRSLQGNHFVLSDSKPSPAEL